MNDNLPWFENEEFWQMTEPFMFYEDHLAKTPLEVDAVLKLTNTVPGARILDLCCGIGRHSLEFSRRSFAVTGVDRTASYLDKARRQAENEKLSIEFVQSDMGKFIREEAFDLAISMFTSFSYFDNHEDNIAVLKSVYKSLKSGGKMFIEMAGKEILAMNWCERDWIERNGVIIAEERKVIDNWSKIDSRWIVITKTVTKQFHMRHWLYSPSDLSAMLKQAGFSSVEIFGSLEGTPYDHTARRLIAVAEKS